LAQPGTFRLVPPTARLAELAQDYQEMRDMFLDPPASFDVVLKTRGRLGSPDKSNRLINFIRPFVGLAFRFGCAIDFLETGRKSGFSIFARVGISQFDNAFKSYYRSGKYLFIRRNASSNERKFIGRTDSVRS
jgi:hypothetical protein